MNGLLKKLLARVRNEKLDASLRDRRRTVTRTLRLESLQKRELFAVDVSLADLNHTLKIEGTDVNDDILVKYMPNAYGEDTRGKLVVFDHGTKVKEVQMANEWHDQFNSNTLYEVIEKIEFHGHKGNDTFAVFDGTPNHLPAFLKLNPKEWSTT